MNSYTLEEFNELAYEFAIRNPKVIELLKQPLTKENILKLNKFGINANSYTDDLDTKIFSLQELYLDYKQFEEISIQNHSPEGAGKYFDHETFDLIDDFKGEKIIYHPDRQRFLYQRESDIAAIKRIELLIESRGKKLSRLMSKEAFKNYDKYTFEGKTIYAIDPTSNNKKTINNDIKFINEWIQPIKYLQLIPQFENIIKV